MIAIYSPPWKLQIHQLIFQLRIALEKEAQLTESNESLLQQVEALGAKLMAQRDSEATMADNYQQELQAKAKLADLYKSMF